jgi:hypothetical protein
MPGFHHGKHLRFRDFASAFATRQRGAGLHLPIEVVRIRVDDLEEELISFLEREIGIWPGTAANGFVLQPS